MGLSATFCFDGAQWSSEIDPGAATALVIGVFDSDIAEVGFGTGSQRQGGFFLGFEPRHYFEDPQASQPVDASSELGKLADWARTHLDRDVDLAAMRALLAASDGTPPPSDFVEETLVEFLSLLGLELPPLLRG